MRGKRALTEKAPTKVVALSEAERHKVADAVGHLNLSEHPKWWATLSALSSKTEFDGLEVFEDEIVRDAGATTKAFTGNANVYVKLVYGGNQDQAWTADSFPLRFTGHFDGVKVVIDDISVDTSSFHGEQSVEVSGPVSE